MDEVTDVRRPVMMNPGTVAGLLTGNSNYAGLDFFDETTIDYIADKLVVNCRKYPPFMRRLVGHDCDPDLVSGMLTGWRTNDWGKRKLLDYLQDIRIFCESACGDVGFETSESIPFATRNLPKLPA